MFSNFTLNKQQKFCLSLLSGLVLISCTDDQQSQQKPTADPMTEEAQVGADAHEHQAPTTVLSKNEITSLYELASQSLFIGRPMSATQFGLATIGDQYVANQIDNYSPETEKAFRQTLRDYSDQITAFVGVNDEQIENQKVIANITRYYAGDPNFDIGYIDTWMGLSPYIINQINGPLIDVPRTLQTDHAISNQQQALDYVARLAQFEEFVGSVVTKFEYDAKQGWLAPKVVLNGAVRYLDNFLSEDPKKHPLYLEFVKKTEKITDLSREERNVLLMEVESQITEVVYPAFQKARDAVKAKLENASDNHGIWSQPNGEAYYLDAIRQLGDSSLTAEQIHTVGLAEVDRISAEMDKILRAQGYKKGTVGARMMALLDESRFIYPDSEKGRAKLLADLNVYIEEITKVMAPEFKTIPPYEVEVRAFPKEIQDGAPGGQYTPPALDGSKPGIYWINLRDMKANPSFGLKTLTYHEANPGHHWQIAINLAQDSLPMLRRIAPYNAYVEGWALYSELVAKELGMYKDDPFGDLGRLQAELFRAVRLVVDTGLHHKRWTREQAIEYMAKATGTAESDVIAEIERYIAWPGQALGYKLGMLTIVELRNNAQAQLGERFSRAEFHDLVLTGGAVPMTVLEEKVNAWVASKKANAE